MALESCTLRIQPVLQNTVNIGHCCIYDDARSRVFAPGAKPLWATINNTHAPRVMLRVAAQKTLACTFWASTSTST